MLEKNQKETALILSLIKENRFMDAFEAAEKAGEKDINNYLYFFLKGVCHIFMNRLDDALLDVGESIYLNPHSIPSKQAVAYILMCKEDYEGAVNKWLNILEADPKNKLIKKVLKKFKKQIPHKASINFNPYLYIELPKIQKVRKKFPFRKIALTFLFLSLAAGLFTGGYFLFFKKIPIEDLTGFFKNKEILYSFTGKEIEFYKMQVYDLIKMKQYNQSKIILNKLYYSNASFEDKKVLKEREKELEFPDKDSIDLKLQPEQVLSYPKIYQDCFVIWSGEVKDVTQKEKYLALTFNPGEREIKASGFQNFPLVSGNRVKIFGKIRLYGQDKLELEIYHIEKE